MKTYLSLLVSKWALFFGKIFHRGSVLPGSIARKIDPDIIRHITLPENIIAVTGSSGKTSTSFMIADILKKAGYRVEHNLEGSNLLNGITTIILKQSSLSGKPKCDFLVLEVDERYTKQIFDAIHPTHVVIGNITRDQPPRHGHFKVVYHTIESAINYPCHLFLNGDDPMLLELSYNHPVRVTFFGLSKNKESFKHTFTNNPDMVYCPKCHTKLKYDFVSFGNVGKYDCPNCDFKRPKLDYEITKIYKNRLTINGIYSYLSKTDIIYNYYNQLASFSVCHTLLIDAQTITKALEETKLQEKRYVTFEYRKRNGFILSGKNENAPSYNQAILYVSKKKGLKTLIFGFEYISLRYPYQDISWLYDIDFELIKDEDVDRFIAVGPFAYDIASRLHIAGINTKKIITCKTINEVYDKLEKTKGDIYAVLNLGTDKKFAKELKQHHIDIK